MLKSDNYSASVSSNIKKDIPIEWDWRKYGIVTPARHQKTCGSSWSFAAASAVESHLMKVQIAEGKFDPEKQLTISEQNLIDCSRTFGNFGCQGGNTRQAFNYLKENKGANTIPDYPYYAINSFCQYNRQKRIDIDIREVRRIQSGDDDDLMAAIYMYGPVTVGFHATNQFKVYESGIFEDSKCDAEQIDHALVAIGYTSDYFILKNSWGPNWGEDGFIKVSRSKINLCGISEQSYYPVLANDVGTDNMKDKLKEIHKMKSSIVNVIQLSLVLLLLFLLDLSYIESSAPVPLPVAGDQPDIPFEWDWRTYGIVTPPKKRDSCFASYSFAAVSALESHLMKIQISEGKFDPSNQLILSEQNLIDCSTSFGNMGCNGGFTRNAFAYINVTKGLNTYKDYPYTGKFDHNCHYNYINRVDIDIKEIKRITTGSDRELATAIYRHGPVTVAIHETKKLVDHRSGIYVDYLCDAHKINVAMIAVGYHPNYFIIKNNYGTNWGENGYFRLSRTKVNNCGVSEQAYYPVLANDIDTDKIR
ncbi:uncharacterized protein LOC128962790, partial [Oppia nitens]|uniref:uncharacterized protein LOC128962790 n=1 Tax=Oppia nitens TaxID=1686743 RepID=UPI0023DB0D3F